MSLPLVSIVIPAYNATRTLRATVQSALEQTFQDFEIVIVDDGSKDETFKLAQELANEDSRIKALTQPNGGAAAARNAGIEAARGKYVALLDADDLWLADKLNRQVEFLEANQNVFAVQCGALFVNDAMQVLSVRQCTDTGNSFRESLLFENIPAFLSALIARRDKLIEVGMFDTKLEILEEWDMALKMSRFGKMRSIVEPLVLYRVHAGNRHSNVGIHIKPGQLILQRLFDDPTIPDDVLQNRRRIYGTFYRTLAGGYFNQKQYKQFVSWFIKSVTTDPHQIAYMLQLPLRILARRRSRALAGDKTLTVSKPSS